MRTQDYKEGFIERLIEKKVKLPCDKKKVNAVCERNMDSLKALSDTLSQVHSIPLK